MTLFVEEVTNAMLKVLFPMASIVVAVRPVEDSLPMTKTFLILSFVEMAADVQSSAKAVEVI